MNVIALDIHLFQGAHQAGILRQLFQGTLEILREYKDENALSVGFYGITNVAVTKGKNAGGGLHNPFQIRAEKPGTAGEKLRIPFREAFGYDRELMLNDDKPALRLENGRWYAYGTPWCGKDGINQNKKVPLAGICFLQQAKENKIRRLSKQEAISRIFSQTLYRFKKTENLDLMLQNTDRLVRKIPVFELHNLPEPAAAMLSYETMSRAAQEEIK